jgi:hypothetical protein
MWLLAMSAIPGIAITLLILLMLWEGACIFIDDWRRARRRQ